MRRLAVVALVMVACGNVAAHAQTLALAFAPGNHYHYILRVTSKETIDAGVMTVPVQMELTANETWTVKSVDSSGVADVTLTLTNITMKMSAAYGQTSTSSTITKLPLPVQEFKIARDGRVMSANGVSLSGMAQYGLVGGGYLVSAVLPDHAVKPGDKWSKNFDQANPSGSGTIHVTTKSEYLRDDTVKGVKAAKVETKSTESIELTINVTVPPKPIAGQGPASPIGPSLDGIGPMTIKGTVTSDVTTWIDPGSHRILKSQMSSKNEMTVVFSMTSAPGTNPQTPFVLPETITMKGSQTLDQEPA